MNIRLLPIVAVALAVAAPVAAQESRTKVHSHESVTAEVHAAMRDAQATIREVIRDVEVDVRSIEREVVRHSVQVRVSPKAGWAAKSWAESQESRRGPEQTERISKTFKVGPNGTLDLSNVSGDIVINEGGGDTISVEAVKHARGTDTKEQFARTKVSMVERGGRVEVMTDYTREGCTEGRRGNCNSASVDYTVTAPAGTAMNLRSVSGDIRITNIRGELRAESVSGDVTAQGATGATLLKSVSGDVDVSAVATQTELRMESVSGDVKVHGAKIRSLAAETVSGDLDLGDIVTDRVTGKSVSGSVTYSGTVSRGGRYILSSHSGDIHLYVPADAGFELDAKTFSGNVRSDLPLTVGGPGREAVKTSRDRGLRGTYGDAGALLSLSSFSGNIVVAKAGTGPAPKK